MDFVSTGLKSRKYFACSRFDPKARCAFRISGSESDVLGAAVQHAVSAHGYRGWQELRIILRATLREEDP